MDFSHGPTVFCPDVMSLVFNTHTHTHTHTHAHTHTHKHTHTQLSGREGYWDRKRCIFRADLKANVELE